MNIIIVNAIIVNIIIGEVINVKIILLKVREEYLYYWVCDTWFRSLILWISLLWMLLLWTLSLGRLLLWRSFFWRWERNIFIIGSVIHEVEGLLMAQALMDDPPLLTLYTASLLLEKLEMYVKDMHDYDDLPLLTLLEKLESSRKFGKSKAVW